MGLCKDSVTRLIVPPPKLPMYQKVYVCASDRASYQIVTVAVENQHLAGIQAPSIKHPCGPALSFFGLADFVAGSGQRGRRAENRFLWDGLASDMGSGVNSKKADHYQAECKRNIFRRLRPSHSSGVSLIRLESLSELRR
jgi:hypothetical protein